MAVVNLADATYGFFIPSVSLMGVGSSKEVGAKAAELGAKKCMIVTDAGLAKMGVAAKIQENIIAAGVECIVYDGAEPNPTDKNVHDGVKVYVDNKCDFIVSLGGGSSHDCGKGIGLVTAGGGHIRDYEGVNQSTVPMTPIISINTTAGTASEMTRFCIITNTDTKSSARGTFTNNNYNDRYFYPRHFTNISGNSFCLPSLFSTNTRECSGSIN